jgi:hypothetical protein
MREREFFHRFHEGLPMRTKLLIAASLGVLVGIEIGYLVSQGGVSMISDLWNYEVVGNNSCSSGYFLSSTVFESFWAIFSTGPRPGRPFVIVPFVAAAILILKLGCMLGSTLLDFFSDRTRNRIVVGVLFLSPLLSYLGFGFSTAMLVWCAIVVFYVIGRTPLIVDGVAFLLVAVLPYFFRPAELQIGVYLLLLFLTGLALYPAGVSFKRFLSPRRGVV